MNLPLNTDLTGKVAVVTGAAGTLCSVFSKALAASGAKVALLGRTYANVQKLAEEITAEGFEAHADELFDQAENRLHAQKAVMYLLMGEQ